MKKHIFLLIMSCFLGLAGCRSVPFKETVLVPLHVDDPKSIPVLFNRLTPDSFTLVNSLVFNYYWHSFASIGVCRVDMKKDSIIVVGMNQMGIKLFELSGKPGSVECSFAIDELKKYEKFPETVISDIYRIYFNHFSVSNSEIIKGKYKICFIVPYQKGKLYYYFGGSNLYLLEKKYVENSDELWKISFYEYILEDGKLFPRGIVFDNFKYDYQIVIRLKEVQELI